jgi:endonuclease YncB( thermonuclease family)
VIEPAYRYRATLQRAIDGDTYILRIDLGFHASVAITIRVRGLNTPELHGTDRPLGLASKTAAELLLANAKVIVLETYKDEQSFARWIADVYVDGESLADKLIAANFGVRA